MFGEKTLNDKLYENAQKRLSGGAYALLFGGVGYEREISLEGALEFIKEVPDDIPLAPIYIDESGEYNLCLGLTNTGILDKKLLMPIDLVRRSAGGVILTQKGEIPIIGAFPLLHGDFGEDGIVQGHLASLGIPFIGSLTLGGAVSSDKAYSKLVAKTAGVPTLPFELISGDAEVSDAFRIADRIGYPVFIKPCGLGSSIGAHLVKSADELQSALSDALLYSKRLMIEPAIVDKRELECAYLSLGGENIITPPGEAVFDSSFYDYDAKYKSSRTRVHPIADVSRDVSARIVEYTERLARALMVRHIARFDYFLTSDGDIYFNEVNTVPGFCKGSLYPLMLRAAGVDMKSFVRLAFSKDSLVW